MSTTSLFHHSFKCKLNFAIELAKTEFASSMIILTGIGTMVDPLRTLAVLQDTMRIKTNDIIEIILKVNYSTNASTDDILIMYDFTVMGNWKERLISSSLLSKSSHNSGVYLEELTLKNAFSELRTLEILLDKMMSKDMILEVHQRFEKLLNQYFDYTHRVPLHRQIEDHEKSGFIWKK